MCGGSDIADAWSKQLQFSLRRLAKRSNLRIGALCTASYLLARAGLLDGYRCTIHWENIASLREEFPNVQVTDDLFVVDRDRFSCAGGQAALDLMLKLIYDKHGNELVTRISEQFMCERIRSSEDRQRVPLHLALGSNQPKLTEAVTLMEANIAAPARAPVPEASQLRTDTLLPEPAPEPGKTPAAADQQVDRRYRARLRLHLGAALQQVLS